MKLVKNFDEAFKNMASGMDMRPTTRTTTLTPLLSLSLARLESTLWEPLRLNWNPHGLSAFI